MGTIWAIWENIFLPILLLGLRIRFGGICMHNKDNGSVPLVLARSIYIIAWSLENFHSFCKPVDEDCHVAALLSMICEIVWDIDVAVKLNFCTWRKANENDRLPIGSLNFLPQDNAADVYHMVRLGAGTLHLAKYLIRSAVYILSAKVWKEFVI